MRALLLGQAVSSAGRGVFMATTAVYFTQVIGLEVRAVGLALSVITGQPTDTSGRSVGFVAYPKR